MRPTVFIFLLVILSFGFRDTLLAQNPGVQSHYVEADLHLKGYEFKGNRVHINYEIPYSGMVEIRLFDPEGKQIWQNQYPHKFGENKIVLNLQKFEPGQTYSYVLNYKKAEVTDRLVIPQYSSL